DVDYSQCLLPQTSVKPSTTRTPTLIVDPPPQSSLFPTSKTVTKTPTLIIDPPPLSSLLSTSKVVSKTQSPTLIVDPPPNSFTIITQPTRTVVTSKSASKSFTVITDPPFSTFKPSSSIKPSSTTCSIKNPLPTQYPPLYGPIPYSSVYLLEVNELPNSAAHLTTTGINGPYSYSANSPTGSTVSVKINDPCNPRTRYLSIDERFPYSYKPIIWTSQVQTKYWVLSPGTALYTAPSSPFGAIKWFLACGPEKQLYLLAGSDYPQDVECEETMLVLGQ
ncbi:hypothetical protein FRC03_006502, partial [Tulasnella sp. 419]